MHLRLSKIARLASRLALSLALLFQGTPARAAARFAPDKGATGFADARHGDVPEGAAELVTQQADQSIQKGLAWLARTQTSDGSFGSGMYRGNIAVTSLAGLAFMSSGSSPG